LLLPVFDCRFKNLTLPVFQFAIGIRHSSMCWMAGRPRLLHIKKQLGRFLWSQAIPTWAML